MLNNLFSYRIAHEGKYVFKKQPKKYKSDFYFKTTFTFKFTSSFLFVHRN